jgi:hypothetical protein
MVPRLGDAGKAAPEDFIRPAPFAGAGFVRKHRVGAARVVNAAHAYVPTEMRPPAQAGPARRVLSGMSKVNPGSRSWPLYVARAARKGISERTALALIERSDLVTRLERAGVAVREDQPVEALRMVARGLSRSQAP